MTVQAESFHLNGHIIGFRPQTQKLESSYKTPSNTLAVKGLKGLWHEGIAVLGQFCSGQVNFYLSSHRVLIQLSVLNITKKIVKKEKKFFNCRFIVQSLGYLNSSYN